ncbi:uncharacterized protein MELLADRAFT_63007 [Melampsora larici-populina 98AG31]|uniref:Uncharacterized protein n=1 Tax=Melampsora larici-populina (strain 98AG31 / pathotype 3-4-7) TaxID=747676 RepID=F4RKY0_MELLP|nr:uncharacterized protein MELLADRAFT_63007 [Melampsora larici-populina 98AG31]EGG06802.1 hypothetical protein MELLADRAFT_63007 [Melampsora larici-populina 98AG31]
MCRGLADLQERLIPVKHTSIRKPHHLPSDGLQVLQTAQAQYHPALPKAPINKGKGKERLSPHSRSPYQSPQPTPSSNPIARDEATQATAMTTNQSRQPPSNSMIEVALVTERTGPIFSHNIFNDPDSTPPLPHEDNMFFSSPPPIIDLTGQLDTSAQDSNVTPHGEPVPSSSCDGPPMSPPRDTDSSTLLAKKKKKSKPKRRTKQSGLVSFKCLFDL